MGNSTQQQDLWLRYQGNQPDDIAAIIAALYYLPDNFKLLISKSWEMPTDYADIAERIQRETEQTSPSLFIDIQNDPTSENKPAILLAPDTNNNLQQTTNGHIAATPIPEAIASAALRLNRAQNT